MTSSAGSEGNKISIKPDISSKIQAGNITWQCSSSTRPPRLSSTCVILPKTSGPISQVVAAAAAVSPQRYKIITGQQRITRPTITAVSVCPPHLSTNRQAIPYSTTIAASSATSNIMTTNAQQIIVPRQPNSLVTVPYTKNIQAISSLSSSISHHQQPPHHLVATTPGTLTTSSSSSTSTITNPQKILRLHVVGTLPESKVIKQINNEVVIPSSFSIATAASVSSHDVIHKTTAMSLSSGSAHGSEPSVVVSHSHSLPPPLPPAAILVASSTNNNVNAIRKRPRKQEIHINERAISTDSISVSYQPPPPSASAGHCETNLWSEIMSEQQQHHHLLENNRGTGAMVIFSGPPSAHQQQHIVSALCHSEASYSDDKEYQSSLLNKSENILKLNEMKHVPLPSPAKRGRPERSSGGGGASASGGGSHGIKSSSDSQSHKSSAAKMRDLETFLLQLNHSMKQIQSNIECMSTLSCKIQSSSSKRIATIQLRRIDGLSKLSQEDYLCLTHCVEDIEKVTEGCGLNATTRTEQQKEVMMVVEEIVEEEEQQKLLEEEILVNRSIAQRSTRRRRGQQV